MKKTPLKTWGKKRSSVLREYGPVIEFVVGNQPPLSVAFRYCNTLEAKYTGNKVQSLFEALGKPCQTVIH